MLDRVARVRNKSAKLIAAEDTTPPEQPVKRVKKKAKKTIATSVNKTGKKIPTASGKKRKAPAQNGPKTAKAGKTGKISNGLKSSKAELVRAKVDVADVQAIKVTDLKKKLNGYVKSLAATVNADWHDSYEQTGEEVCEWFQECGDAVSAALRVTGKGCCYDKCHEVFKLIADTWSNINAIPFRGEVSEDVSSVDSSIDVDMGGEECGTYRLSSPGDLLSLAWPCLLARAAANKHVPDEVLLHMIKDAVDHGVHQPHMPHEEEDELMNQEDDAPPIAGRARLAQLFARKAEWSALASTKKNHKMRRCIDRRFR